MSLGAGGNRVEAAFARLRAEGRKGLMPFLCGGRPSLGAMGGMLAAAERGGASVVEIGFPFSDPIADGPVIAAAMHEALLAGVTPRGVLDAVAAARAGVGVGIVAMVSVSLAHRLGVRDFVRDAKAAGFDGFIFPDAPLEEAERFAGPARDSGMTASLLVAPTTPMARVERVARACSGFVYVLARAGITGGAGGEWRGLSARIAEIRGVTDLPLACGFGVSTAEDVRAAVLEAGADAAIVGSALVRRVEEAARAGKDAAEATHRFVDSLRAGLARPGA